MKPTLRSLFAVLAATLAFASAGAGGGAGESRDAGFRSASKRLEHRAGTASHAMPAAARMLLRGSGLVLEGPSRRAGAPPPRLAPGSQLADDLHFAARTARQRAAGVRARGILARSLARRLAAARDGTVSSRSNGVPPPALA